MKQPFTKKVISITTMLILIVLIGCNKDEFNDSNILSSTNLSTKSVELDIVSTWASEDKEESYKVFDKDESSRWAVNGDEVKLNLDLEQKSTVDYLKINFYKGDERKYEFKVYVRSEKGETWQLVGTKTSKAKGGFETFDVVNASDEYNAKNQFINDWFSLNYRC